MNGLLPNFRFAQRQLRKSPVFTVVAIVSLALGIGANTAIFTLIDQLLLKSLPVHDPKALVAFGQEYGAGAIDGIGPGPLDLFPYEFYQQIENQHEAFAGITAYASFTSRLSVRQATSSGGSPEQATGHLVSGNFFEVLGASTALGRSITRADTVTPGSNPVAVISYQYWQQEFASDRNIVGKSMVVNGTPFTVIGVAAPGFYGVALDQNPPDMWLPLTMQKEIMVESFLNPHGLYFLHLMGRRNARMSLEQMQEWVNLQLRHYMSEREGAQLTPVRGQEIQKIYVPLMPGGRGVSNLRVEYTEPLRILMGLVALVLLVACVNLANFLLAKATSREKEISTRLALGASRSRVVFQMLTEALLLSFLGGAAGLLLASWGTRILVHLVVAGASYTPISSDPDIRVLAFTFGLSLLTGIVFGLAPALRVSRVSVAPGLAGSARSIAGGSFTARFLPKSLVAFQMGLGLVLVLTAALLARTLRNLEQQDVGFERQNLLCVTFDSKIAQYKENQLGPLHRRILERTQSLPGVRSAAISGGPPISEGNWDAPIYPRGYAAQTDEDMSTLINRVSDRYFETVGIPLLAGRPIGSQDLPDSTHVVVINQEVANYFFPRGNALGQRITFGEPDLNGEWEIVGVVKDAKYNSPRETTKRMVYVPTAQMTGSNAYASWLQLRSAGDPKNIEQEVRRALTEIDPNLPIIRIETISQRLDLFTGKEALISQLSIFFSSLALLLACIGLYGVMTYNVLRRTNEIGVRMALGAQSGGVLWLVLKESLTLLGIGILVGVPAALAATRMLQSQLFGVKPSDPLTVVAAVLVVGVTTLIAGYFPARRASLVDPLVALRYE